MQVSITQWHNIICKLSHMPWWYCWNRSLSSLFCCLRPWYGWTGWGERGLHSIKGESQQQREFELRAHNMSSGKVNNIECPPLFGTLAICQTISLGSALNGCLVLCLQIEPKEERRLVAKELKASIEIFETPLQRHTLVWRKSEWNRRKAEDAAKRPLVS